MTNDPTDVQGGFIERQLHETVVRAIVELVRTPVIVHDGVRIGYANQAARRFLGMPAGTEAAGTMLNDVFAPAARRDEDDVAKRVRIRSVDGRDLTVLATDVRVFGPSGATVATFLEDTDEVTVPFGALAELARSPAASELSAGLARELASPISVMLTSLEEISRYNDLLGRRPELAKDPVLDQIHEYLELTSLATRTLESVLRNHGQLLGPATSFATQKLCDVRAAVDHAVRLARPRISQVGQLVVSLDLVPAIRATSGCLTQIALNLLNNAADGLPPQEGWPRGRIEIRLRGLKTRVVLEISNNGPGIEPHALARLLELQDSADPRISSLGRSLAICRALVDSLDGKLSVVSIVGQGTTFVVTLPVAADEQAGTPDR